MQLTVVVWVGDESKGKQREMDKNCVYFVVTKSRLSEGENPSEEGFQ